MLITRTPWMTGEFGCFCVHWREVSRTLECVYRVLVERILNTSLVPYSLEPAERMRRLFSLYGNLDDHAVK